MHLMIYIQHCIASELSSAMQFRWFGKRTRQHVKGLTVHVHQTAIVHEQLAYVIAETPGYISTPDKKMVQPITENRINAGSIGDELQRHLSLEMKNISFRFGERIRLDKLV